jgi:DNA-binding transcriptional MocR family regulator
MTERRRRLVADLAAELDLTVIEDNTIHDLALVEPPPAIASMATGGTIITVGSMSKLFWGGLRIGWARAPEPVTARLGRLKLVHDHGSSIVSQLVARRLLLHEVPRAIAARRAQIRGHLDLVLRFFAERLPDWEITHPAGGVALWLRLPRGDAAELAQVALSHGVAVVPGGLFSPEEAYADRLRISLVRDINTFHEGLHRLAAAWEEYSADHRASRPELSLVV